MKLLELNKEQYEYLHSLLLQEKRIIYKNKDKDNFIDKINFIYELIEKLSLSKEQD